jgi:type IV secretory pathway protease TraF
VPRSFLSRCAIAAAIFVPIGLGVVSYARWAELPRIAVLELGVSMPRGIYIYDHASPAVRGEVILMDKAPRWKRAYLMKRVVGTQGMRYCWDPERGQHQLDDRWMPAPSPHAAEIGLKPWRGCRKLRSFEVVGYTDFSEIASYDSRYFGPVRNSQIAGVYRLLLPLP